MDANGLLSVLALLLAGFTFLPDARRLDLKLRISVVEIYCIGLIILTISAIVLSPVIVQNFGDLFNNSIGVLSENYIGIKMSLPIPWVLGFESETLIFSLHMIIILYFWLKLRGKKIATSKIGEWGNIAKELLQEKKFPELTYLLNRHHEQLFTLSREKPWYVRVKYKIKLRNKFDISWPIKTESKWISLFNGIRNKISQSIPSQSKNQAIINRTLENIFKSNQFVVFLIDTYPLLAAKASLLSMNNIDDYRSFMFKYLMSDTAGQLYSELKYNRNSSYTGRFDIDPSNTLLTFYLSDIEVADKVGIHNSVGEYVIDFIKKQQGKDNYYNLSYDNFGQSDESDRCPIFMGIMFFEIAIPEVIYQRFDDHLGLIKSQMFIKEILNSLDRSSKVDIDREFPTKFDYLIFKIFNACNHWVHTSNHLTEVQVKDSYAIKCATETLGGILRLILASDKTTSRQKTMYVESVISTIILLEGKNYSDLSEDLFYFSIRRFKGDGIDKVALNAFKLHIREIDSMVRCRAAAIEERLLAIHQ